MTDLSDKGEELVISLFSYSKFGKMEQAWHNADVYVN